MDTTRPARNDIEQNTVIAPPKPPGPQTFVLLQDVLDKIKEACDTADDQINVWVVWHSMHAVTETNRRALPRFGFNDYVHAVLASIRHVPAHRLQFMLTINGKNVK
jgi:hypothetical protein